jgi:7-cyano-7-deazaguanine synthase
MGVVRHRVVPLDLRWIGGSALTAPLPVPKGRSDEQMRCGVPDTYVPARNTILLSYALVWAEVIGANDIFCGFNVLDASGYPDCRAAFVNAYERMANLATRATVEWHRRLQIHTPLIGLTKAEIIKKGLALGVDYSLTSSCYDPQEGTACGLCDACQLRRKGFAEVGIADPIPYTEIARAS